jgi:hypothetical protein
VHVYHNPIRYYTKEPRIPPDLHAGDLYTLHLHDGKHHVTEEPSTHLAKRKSVNIPSRKSTQSHAIKKLRVKGNPPYIQNKQERDHGTLKRRDYLQPDHLVRADDAAGYVV